MSDTSVLDPNSSDGSVFCGKANLWFPHIYAEFFGEARKNGLPEWPSYELSSSPKTETETCRRIEWLENSAPTSLLIKNHKTRKEAIAFFDGILAFDPSQRLSDIVETRYGIFTISRIPTYASWPTPMVVFVTHYPAENLVGTDDYWEFAISSKGEVIEGNNVFHPHDVDFDVPEVNELTLPFGSRRII